MGMINNFLTPFFFMLLEISVKSAFLVIVIFVIKFIFGSKMSLRIHYVIWLIFFIRLILPFDLDFNINPPTTQVRDYASNQIVKSVMIIRESVSVNTFSAFDIIAVIWFIVAIFFLLKNTISIIRFSRHRELKNYVKDKRVLNYLSECMKRIRLDAKVSLIETELIRAPCVIGFFNFKILMPAGLIKKLNDRELECVLFHELVHIKRFDFLINYFIVFLKCIYWFNPLVYVSVVRMNRDCETECDSKTIELIGRNNFKIYGFTLIKILRFFSTGVLSRMFPGIVDNKNHIIRRLKMMTQNKRRPGIISVAAMSLVLVSSGVTFIGKIFAEPKGNTEITKGNIFISPLENPVTTGKFGDRINPITNKKDFHSGIDLAQNKGARIKASGDGIIIKIENNEKASDLGKYIIISHENGFKTLYAKLDKIDVVEGQKIKAGDIIGNVGETGIATGPHLHFEIQKDDKPVNPEDYIKFAQ